MPPAPTRQLYINCKYMSIKKRRKTTKNYKKQAGRLLPACGEIGFRNHKERKHLQIFLLVFCYQYYNLIAPRDFKITIGIMIMKLRKHAIIINFTI